MLAIMDSTDVTEEFNWLPEGLESVALRLARADECAFKIGDLISMWSLEGPLRFEQVRSGEKFEVFVKSVRSVPPEASLLFSEAVNHLRAAIDNVIWYLVEREHGRRSGPAASLVSMPIMESQEKLDNWTRRRVKDKITAFGNDTHLGRRLRTLQPFVDLQSGVPSVGVVLAALMRQDVETAHPLRLLQAYSNADKHRAVRVAMARTFTSTDSTPLIAQDLAHQEIKVGDSMGPPMPWGQLSVLETNTAAMVQRPDPFAAWINPVKEINALRRHVGDVVVPILLTGLEMPKAIPPAIDVTDNGLSPRERIIAGTWDDADVRLQSILRTRYQEAESRGLETLETRDVPSAGQSS